jgi:hypothetical protein
MFARYFTDTGTSIEGFEYKMARRIFGFKKEQVKGERIQLYNEVHQM